MMINQISKESLNQNTCANFKTSLLTWMMSKSNSIYDKFIGDRKRSLLGNIQGKVLEIDPGIGSNLPYYPKNIHLIGIEPNPYMYSYLYEEAEKQGLNIDIRNGNTEWIDANDNSVDAVVSTLVLCSVPNINYTLQAILRVLKPGGRFLFIEHVAAPKGTILRQMQSTISPIWKALSDGCHPDKEIWIALEKAGFSSLNYEHFEVPLPIVSPHIMGVAIK